MPMAESGLCIGDALLNRSPFLSVRRLDHSREKNGAKREAYAENRTPNHDLFFHRPTPCATADPLQTRPRGGQCCRFGNEGATGTRTPFPRGKVGSVSHIVLHHRSAGRNSPSDSMLRFTLGDFYVLLRRKRGPPCARISTSRRDPLRHASPPFRPRAIQRFAILSPNSSRFAVRPHLGEVLAENCEAIFHSASRTALNSKHTRLPLDPDGGH